MMHTPSNQEFLDWVTRADLECGEAGPCINCRRLSQSGRQTDGRYAFCAMHADSVRTYLPGAFLRLCAHSMEYGVHCRT